MKVYQQDQYGLCVAIEAADWEDAILQFEKAFPGYAWTSSWKGLTAYGFTAVPR